MMRKIIYFNLFSILVLFSTGVCIGAPVINSVSGTFSNGSSVSISGSGFGTKNPAAPWLYDDFEGGVNGSHLTGKTPKVGTATYKAYYTDLSIYSRSKAYSGSQSYYQDDQVTGDNSIIATSYVEGQNTQSRYLSYRFYRSGTVSGVWKVDRQTSNLGNGGDNAPYDDPPNWGWWPGYIRYYNNCAAFIETESGVPSAKKDQWNRIELWETISDRDVGNGVWTLWENLTQIYSSSSLVTCTSSCTHGCAIDTWMFPGIVNDASTNWDWWVDDLYIDNTLARVEIGDKAVWGSCTKREIQIPTGWADDSITITVNQGTLQDQEIGYLYVVDENGNINQQGHPIIIGAGGQSPPAPPARLRLSARP